MSSLLGEQAKQFNLTAACEFIARRSIVHPMVGSAPELDYRFAWHETTRGRVHPSSLSWLHTFLFV